MTHFSPTPNIQNSGVCRKKATTRHALPRHPQPQLTTTEHRKTGCHHLALTKMDDFIESLIPHSDTFFHFAANSLTAAASNTTAPIITPAQQNVLRITKIVIGSLSFGTTFLYVLYVLIRTLYTFPFRLLFQCITKKQTSHRSPSSSTSSSRRKSSKKRHRSVNGNLSSKLTSNDRTEPFLLINESLEATIC